jgi:hypothetical protein
MHIRVYVCVYICMYVYILYMHIRMYVCIYICMYVYILYMHLRMYPYARTCMHMYIHTHIHAYIAGSKARWFLNRRSAAVHRRSVAVHRRSVAVHRRSAAVHRRSVAVHRCSIKLIASELAAKFSRRGENPVQPRLCNAKNAIFKRLKTGVSLRSRSSPANSDAISFSVAVHRRSVAYSR